MCLRNPPLLLPPSFSPPPLLSLPPHHNNQFLFISSLTSYTCLRSCASTRARFSRCGMFGPHHLTVLLQSKAVCVCDGCMCVCVWGVGGCTGEEVLLGRGGAPLLICNQVRHPPKPHPPLSPPSRLLSPLSSPLFSLLISLPLLFPASVKEPILSEVEYLNYLLPQLLTALLFVSWFRYQPPPPATPLSFLLHFHF